MSASVAVALTFNAVSSLIVWLAGIVSAGAVFTSFTTTVKLLVALRLGVPSSKTRTVTTLVLGPCASLGIQAIAPFAATVRPAGPDTSAKVSVLAGRSASVAVALTFNVVSSLIVWLAGIVSAGAVFTSFTTTVKLLVALRLGVPSSKTRTVTTLVLGPCASLGVQAIAPFAATVNPTGPDTSAKVSVLAGMSASVAVALTFNAVSSLIVWLAGIVSAGAVFTAFTTTVKLLLSVNGGVPLSATWTVKVLVLGPWISVGVHLTTPLASMVAP